MKRADTSLITRFLSVILCVLCLFPIEAAAAADPYWGYQAAYNDALASNDSAAICKAAEDIVNHYKSLSDITACYRSEMPARNAAKHYELQGKYSDAKRMYESLLHIYRRTKQLVGDNSYDERIKYAEAFLESYQSLEPTVYVNAKDPADVPYYGAKNEPELGTYVGMCGDTYDEGRSNAFLLYVQFKNETIRSFSWRLPETDDYYMLEVAWNTADEHKTIEHFRSIANGSMDAYLKADLEFLGSLDNCGILLRFGAEINEWEVNTTYHNSGRLNEFKRAFIDAFRHVHDLAERYAPNVAMVYSPNDISNGYVSYEDFYPGDAYVDWVGFSSYGNMSKSEDGAFGSMNDALYKIGKYTNQLNKIAELVSLYGDRKPLFVSECGFLYKSDSNTKQTEAYARERMKFFYAYINMVYPQVKAIFYFNTNYNGNCYQLFGDGGNKNMGAAYDAAIAANLPIKGTLNGTPTGYTRLETLCEKTDVLDLALYAYYPGDPTKTVTYTLDGKVVKTTSTVPYSASINTKSLAPGRHTLKVKTEVGQSTYIQTYYIYITQTGLTRASLFGEITDIKKTSWAYAPAEYCVIEGFFEGLIADGLFEPKRGVDRALFVTLLGRAAGIDVDAYAPCTYFSDVDTDAYYSRYVTWAKESHITAGTSTPSDPNPQFSPTRTITRGEACAMIVNYCDYVGIPLPEADLSNKFADHDRIQSFFVDPIYRFRNAGIIFGRDGNIFDPRATITRQEIVVILKNFHQKYILN